MENFGKIYKLMRQARNITLKEATGEEFSISMLSRFENGSSELSAYKLFRCLDNIYLSIAEFDVLAHEFEKPSLYKLVEKINHYSDLRDIEKLSKLADSELQSIRLDGKEKFHTLNNILIKSRIKSLEDCFQVPDSDIKYVHDYLFTMDKWASYELILFSETVHLFDSNSYIYYCREMLHRSDFFNQLPYNSTLIQTMLVNGVFYLSEKKEFTSAAYLIKTIEETFHNTRDAFMKIVFIIAKGYFQYQKGNKRSGKDLIQKGIDVYEFLGYSNQAEYYRSEFRNIL